MRIWIWPTRSEKKFANKSAVTTTFNLYIFWRYKRKICKLWSSVEKFIILHRTHTQCACTSSNVYCIHRLKIPGSFGLEVFSRICCAFSLVICINVKAVTYCKWKGQLCKIAFLDQLDLTRMVIKDKKAEHRRHLAKNLKQFRNSYDLDHDKKYNISFFHECVTFSGKRKKGGNDNNKW